MLATPSTSSPLRILNPRPFCNAKLIAPRCMYPSPDSCGRETNNNDQCIFLGKRAGYIKFCPDGQMIDTTFHGNDFFFRLSNTRLNDRHFSEYVGNPSHLVSPGEQFRVTSFYENFPSLWRQSVLMRNMTDVEPDSCYAGGTAVGQSKNLISHRHYSGTINWVKIVSLNSFKNPQFGRRNIACLLRSYSLLVQVARPREWVEIFAPYLWEFPAAAVRPVQCTSRFCRKDAGIKFAGETILINALLLSCATKLSPFSLQEEV